MNIDENRFNPGVFRNIVIDRNGKMGRDVCEIMAAAINAVNPYQCVKDAVGLYGQRLMVGELEIDLSRYERKFIIGFGKASVPMAKALIEIIGQKFNDAFVLTKNKKFQEEFDKFQSLKIFLGGHPLPTRDSVNSTQKILSRLPGLTETDLVFVLISGGGSALFTDPMGGISLEDLQRMTQILLECGADIHEINTLRKHLDRVKGGHLVRRLAPARILSLILSDVIGDSLDMIASGPTVPDPTTFQDAMTVIEKYDLSQQMPISIIETIEDGMGSRIEETLKPQSSDLASVSNFLIGSNIKAAGAAANKAKELGYNTQIISSQLTGDTESTANFLGGIIMSVISHCVPLKRPACLLFGGETTVKMSGKGKGGRNQDLVLRMVKELADKPGILFTSLATDGEDGPTDAAGASADNLVFKDSKKKLNQSIQEFIDNNDSYHFFSKIGGLIKTGATGTNVNDLIIILIK